MTSSGADRRGIDGPSPSPGRMLATSRLRALVERDWFVLGALLVLAAVVRLVGIPGRGDFDGDQGHDMLTLLRLVRDGQIPLLGPPTSIGDFHHGAAYYFLLAPVAWASGVDPGAVIGWIAAMGVAAVGVTWWFACAVGGRAAGAIAGFLLAISPAAIEESTFLWNPNPIPLFAALALACTWRGHVTGRARWRIGGIAAAGMVMQLHVLGVVFLPAILALPLADVNAAWRSGDRQRTRRLLGAMAGGLGLVALLFVPLLIHELQTDFGETRHAVAYFMAGTASVTTGQLDPPARLAFTALRVIAWPLTGLVTAAPAASIVAVSVAVVLGAWLAVAGRGPERTVARWLGASVVWSALTLTLLAPSLQVVVPGLPNDHYHAFLDPVVVVVVALAARALAARALSAGSLREGRAGRSALVLVTGALLGLAIVDVGLWPPTAHPNGGWPSARDAGARIARESPAAGFDVRGLPTFKTAEGIGYPIVAAGGDATIATDAVTALRPMPADRLLVVACDRLFEPVIGDACGGPAEARFIATLRSGTGGPEPTLVDRFDASPRTSVSVYRP